MKLLLLILINSFFTDPYQVLSGPAQGTTYSIKYQGKDTYQKQIDSILNEVDQQLSLWNPKSDLNAINQNKWTGSAPSHILFLYNLSTKIQKKTKGYFDVSIGPLITFYGFHTQDAEIKWKSPPVHLLGKVIIDKNNLVSKKDPDATFDFNAIAQGYTVDLIATYLESKNTENYIVEIGGEIRAKGINQQKEVWQIGIESPINQEIMQKIVSLKNEAMATSGSYQNFKIKKGKKISHIIDPKTGLTVEHSLLSVTVFHATAAEADAYATAFLAMGLEKSQALASKIKLKIYAIFENDKGQIETWKSPTFDAQ
jgi:FAD:protein FMN transferase